MEKVSKLPANQRVRYGVSIEKKIFDALKAAGYPLLLPTTAEDRRDKIDGWWADEPIQIKYREEREDLLFEVVKDYEKWKMGKDWVSKATVWVVWMKGRIVLVKTAQIRDLITDAMASAEEKGFDDYDNFHYQIKGSEITLRIRKDPSVENRGREKIIAYIPIVLLELIGSVPFLG